MVGYIYIINEKSSNIYKIGRTKNTKKRIRELQTGNSKKLVYKKFFNYKGKEPINTVEKTIHKWLFKYNINGEWFYLKPYKFYEKRIENFIQSLNKGNNLSYSVKELNNRSNCNII